MEQEGESNRDAFSSINPNISSEVVNEPTSFVEMPIDPTENNKNVEENRKQEEDKSEIKEVNTSSDIMNSISEVDPPSLESNLLPDNDS